MARSSVLMATTVTVAPPGAVVAGWDGPGRCQDVPVGVHVPAPPGTLTTLAPMSDTSAGPRLLGPADVRALAARLDLRPTKQRGQNFVIDANTVRRIVRESGVGPDDVVVEVGPGLGSLTLALLLEVAGRVVAIEVDDKLAGLLPETIATHAPAGRPVRGRPRRRDARDRAPRPTPTALVANLPYNVSVPVLLHLLALLLPPSSTASSWSRPRWPTGWPPYPAPRCTASPRSRPPGTPTSAGPVPSGATSSGRRPMSTRAWSPGPAATPEHDRDARAGLRGRGRRVRPAPQAAARVLRALAPAAAVDAALEAAGDRPAGAGSR